MKPAGIVLIIAGVLALVYQGISWTEKDTVIDAGPLEVSKTERKSIPLPPILGGVMLVAGIIMIVAGGRRTA